MGTTLEEHVETTLEVIDKATGPLDSVAKHADKTTHALEGTGHAAEHAGGGGHGGFLADMQHTLEHILPMAGALGAAFTLKAAWEGTEKYLKNIKEIHELTGATASETDFLLSQAKQSGVEYEQMSGIMFQLSRRGSMLEQTMQAATTKVPGMAAKFARLGVDLTKGPVSALEQMAKQVKKGKLDAGDLMAQFRVPRGQVNEFKEFLEKLDPSKLKKFKHGGGGLVSDEDLESFIKLEKAQHRVKDAINRVQVTLASKLVPVVADLTEKLADKLVAALPAIERVGKFLADHMEQMLTAAKAYVALMTGKKLLSTFASMAAPGGMLGKLASGGLGGLAKGAGGGLAAIGSQISAIGSALAAAAGPLAVIAAAVGVLYLGFKAVEDNVGGVKDRLLHLWDMIQARFELIGATLWGFVQPLLEIFGAGSGGLMDFIGKVAALSFEKLVQGVDLWLHAAQTLALFWVEFGETIAAFWKQYLAQPFEKWVVTPIMRLMKWMGDGIGKAVDWIMSMVAKIPGFKGSSAPTQMGPQSAASNLLDFMNPGKVLGKLSADWDRAQKQAEALARQKALERTEKAAHREAPDKKPPGTHYDFRGSKFDITQSFAEGFDPDRIATAFSSDLANLGEMRSQSGFAPAFSAR